IFRHDLSPPASSLRVGITWRTVRTFSLSPHGKSLKIPDRLLTEFSEKPVTGHAQDSTNTNPKKQYRLRFAKFFRVNITGNVFFHRSTRSPVNGFAGSIIAIPDRSRDENDRKGAYRQNQTEPFDRSRRKTSGYDHFAAGKRL
ncbi:MAG: hypothetical protein NWQ95_06995, partial [Verrucomicrobiales bacterium]|nr:hypothetical protein [Verrucomicrobiales bacterium]